jgi:hypothetical protein
LGADGRFTLASRLQAGVLSAVHQVEGGLSAPGGMSGQFSARFFPDSPLAAGSDLYCMAWNQNPPVSLPMEEAASALDLDPTALVYTPSFVPGLGVVLTGTDDDRKDRLILYRNGEGALTAIQPDGESYPSGIFRVLPQDPVPVEGGSSFISPLIILPGQHWMAEYESGHAGVVQDKLLLLLRAGSEVTFSRFPGSSAKACSFRVYADLLFETEQFVIALDGNSQSGVMTLNPGENWPYSTWMSDSTTAYLVPLAIAPATDDACEALIRGRALSDLVAKEHADNGGPTLFSKPFPEYSVYLGGTRSASPGQLERIPLGMAPLPFGTFTLNGTAMARPAASGLGDPLHLRDGSTEATLISVNGQATSLNIYPSVGSRTGWGPFVPASQTGGAELAIPGSAAFTATAPGGQSAFRVQLTAVQRIAIWSDGGPAGGHLHDMEGRTLSTSNSGAMNDAGFRMELGLQPGTYVLRVTARAVGEVSVHAEPLSEDPGFPDPALYACLVEAGWSNGARPRSLSCVERGIRNLTGIEALSPELEELNLPRNGITDISPLQDLTSLRVLGLAGNPVTDVTALENLEFLRQLSLANTSVSVENVTAIANAHLGVNLALLDLTGIAAPLDPEMETLRAAYPFALIIGPSGAAVP